MNRLAYFLAVAVALGGAARIRADEAGAIRPGALWRDTSGHVINAHGGGVMFDRGVYWWYGEHKVYGPAGNRAHVGVHVYSSTDLVNWTDRGVALAIDEKGTGDICDGCVIERPKVMRVASTGKYAMHFHLELKGRGYDAARVGIAVADVPEGPFRFIRSERPNGEMSRDMTLFADDDGSAWQICASESNATLRLNRLAPDGLGYTGESHRFAIGDYTEAPAICKRGGWYFLVGSGCTGWRPNTARLYRARALTGPWERLGNPCRGIDPESGLGADITWGAQSTYLLPVAGRSDAVIAMFDVWHPANHEESRYVWLPVTFADDRLWIDWTASWRPCVAPLPKATGFRFMTFNVYGDYDKRMSAASRAPAVAAAIVGAKPDLVSLQEIDDGWWKNNDLVARLNAAGYAVLRGDEAMALKRAGETWGDAALDARRTARRSWVNHEPLVYNPRRFACLESGCEFYHLHLQVEKSVTWGVFEDRTCGRRLIAFATHFWWKRTPTGESDQLRELNARRVVEVVGRLRRKWGEMPVVGGGDLNCGAEEFPLAVFAAAGWANAGETADVRDARPTEHTQPKIGADGKPHGVAGKAGEKGHKTIDHVFYTPGALRATRHAVLADQAVLDVSDHSPVTVDFTYAK